MKEDKEDLTIPPVGKKQVIPLLPNKTGLKTVIQTNFPLFIPAVQEDTICLAIIYRTTNKANKYKI